MGSLTPARPEWLPKVRLRPGPANVAEYREKARRVLPKPVFEFIDGGAEDEITLTDNNAAYKKFTLTPNVARGVKSVDLGRTVLGERLGLPILLAPTGLPGLAHADAEFAAVRAAEAHGTRIVLSTGSSYSLEEVAHEATASHWFQLYAWKNEEFAHTLVDRAEKAGYGALFITLDVPVAGNRERDERNGFTTPPTISPMNALAYAARPKWLMTAFRERNFVLRNLLDSGLTSGSRALSTLESNAVLIDPDFSWDNVKRIRDRWPRRLAVKGILSPEDAVEAVGLGADAIVVSNHGGRQLDGAPATIDALPSILEAVAGRAEVLIDGGIRRGTDVAKAIALGATACLIGRPWLYGLAYQGEAGVSRILDIFRDELNRTLTLIGCKAVDDLGPGHVGRRS